MNRRRLQISMVLSVIWLAGAAVVTAAPASGAVAAGRIRSGPTVGQPVRLAGQAAPFGADWASYQHDVGHSGVDISQPPVRSVTPSWTSPSLDGAVYAQPLVVGGRVLVATEGNSVYSINVADGAVAWQKNLGPAVSSSGFPCGNINPIGITSTPVVDTATNVLYAVALLGAPVRHELFALSLVDGSILWHRTIDAPGADPVVHNQRGALTLSSGQVYVPFGGRAGDCGNYQGRLVAAREDAAGAVTSYTVPTAREGGIWSPAGATVDGSGQVLVATGNSASTTTFDYGEAVIRLSPALSVLDFFAASNWASLNSTDTDIGSVGPTLLADRNRVVQVGKAGVGYLLAANALGGIGGQVFSAQVCAGGGAFGGTAWQGNLLFVPCSDGLVALKVAADGSSFSVAWRGPSGFAGPPIVSGGKVWTLYRNGGLYALNEAGGQIEFQTTVSGFTHFAAPSSGSGHVFVAANGGIAAYRLHSGTAPADFDGDGRSDVAVYRPSTGVWYVSRSGGGTSVVSWGSPGDLAAAGDYDGDGKTDPAVFRPSTGLWYIQLSGGGTQVVNWGASGDIPVPGDYDGDGKADVAVFRPSTGVWYIQLSGGGTSIVNWGSPGDVPVVGDFDGDGKTDLAVFRPSTGLWYVQLSGGGTRVVNWGASGDVPVVGDFDGDGKTDLAVFRPSTGVWYIQLSGGGTSIVNWGSPGDVAVAGDYDGDGKTDLAVFRPPTGVWYVQLSGGGTKFANWGANGDTPIGAPPGA